jgi:hypothetical protein
MVILIGKCIRPNCVKYLFKESEKLQVDHDHLYSRYWLIEKSHSSVPKLTVMPRSEIIAV